MSFDTIGDVLRGVKQYHDKASDYYDALRSTTTDERSVMVLRHMAAQQRLQAQNLRVYLESAVTSVLCYKLQSPIERSGWEAPEAIDAAAANLREISGQMIDIDNTVLRLYSLLSKEQLPPSFEELFERLEEQQKAVAKTNTYNMQAVKNL